MDQDMLRQATDDELTQLMGQLRALEAATRGRLVAVAAEYDRRKAWREDGATSMSGWLAMHGYSRGQATEMVRVGHRLADLPALAGAMDEGLLTWDQSREVTRFAVPETDNRLAEEAAVLSVAELVRIARRSVGVTNEEARDAHERRLLRSRWDHDHTELKFWGRVPADAGAAIEATLDHLASQAPPDPETGEHQPYDRRMADAFTEVCTGALAERATTDPAAATIVIHTDASLLDGSGGAAEVQDGPPLAITTVERLLCDNRWQITLTDSDGCCVGVGTVTRKIPRWMRRQLARRDTGCMFPGCNRTRWLEVHHIVNWKDGGPTELSNLVLICTEHHALIHEGGWTLKGDHNRLTFFRPDGTLLDPAPDRLRPETKERIFGPFRSEPPEGGYPPDAQIDDTS